MALRVLSPPGSGLSHHVNSLIVNRLAAERLGYTVTSRAGCSDLIAKSRRRWSAAAGPLRPYLYRRSATLRGYPAPGALYPPALQPSAQTQGKPRPAARPSSLRPPRAPTTVLLKGTFCSQSTPARWVGARWGWRTVSAEGGPLEWQTSCPVIGGRVPPPPPRRGPPCSGRGAGAPGMSRAQLAEARAPLLSTRLVCARLEARRVPKWPSSRTRLSSTTPWKRSRSTTTARVPGWFCTTRCTIWPSSWRRWVGETWRWLGFGVSVRRAVCRSHRGGVEVCDCVECARPCVHTWERSSRLHLCVCIPVLMFRRPLNLDTWVDAPSSARLGARPRSLHTCACTPGSVPRRVSWRCCWASHFSSPRRAGIRQKLPPSAGA